MYFERIDDVLKNPDLIKESVYDKEVLLYYKFYDDVFGGKYLVVVVKYNEKNTIRTVYITSKKRKNTIFLKHPRRSNTTTFLQTAKNHKLFIFSIR